ncbi:Lysosomal Pro-X carboxypeptidase [Seminavis robusta]|uniref:Lysosomal Pro-X carboxypeptidase n=1 Tax=Seminavis robusta TaxID=568900 RepID=A0A9N8DI29_9STRA|nr:Lysosomal Pro-X carboxypeptidase [Seminavis robusta]|eukprot:Sro155_g070330.1 Lysosomal Pro-X carboxypeptidase (542) ;mRNA; r:17904-19626
MMNGSRHYKLVQNDRQMKYLLGYTLRFLVALLVLTRNFQGCNGKAAPAHYYPRQLVDHLHQNDHYKGKLWSQRYYVWSDHFKGPGSPIFMILGGEGHISPETGIYYPFISDHLAKNFGAFVVQPEHRFYGFSQPLVHANLTLEGNSQQQSAESKRELRGRTLARKMDPRVQLFTAEQALMDAVRLVQHVAQDQLRCSLNKTSSDYCPVITVGGSYPGFLSMSARLRFPDVIDMSYAGSAPVKFYSQQVQEGDYYNHISKVAEKTIPGCSKAVRQALDDVLQEGSSSNYIPAIDVGICPGTLPDYIKSRHVFFEELFMMVGYTFANDNMGNYPPSPQTNLYKDCQIFLDDHSSAVDKVKTFLTDRLGRGSDCFNMGLQLPAGRHATISGGDWSGDGTGTDGESWDFQTCTLLVEKIGFSHESMFPPRNWTLDWMNAHCHARFGVKPRPTELVAKWKFDDLVAANASRILFTNGLNDGWSVGAVKQNLSESLLVLNFENGAHHSDLNSVGPRDTDTEDIKEGYIIIQNILAEWLDGVKALATK